MATDKTDLSTFAVIFDMDGLMLNTEALGLIAWTEAIKSLGYDLPESVFLKMIGLNRGASQQVLIDYFGPQFPAEEALIRRKAIGDQTSEQIETQPGLLELLQLLKNHEIPRAVATSTEYKIALGRLKQVEIMDYFDIIVTGDMVEKSKPDPDIFLEAVNQLGLVPQQCIVLEDSESGIQAAYAAETIPIMVPDLKKPSPEIRLLTYQVCNSLYDATQIIKSDFISAILK